MAIGLVITVRNERSMLRSNLLYHRFLGVEHMWVFDDGSDDGTSETIADLSNVERRDTVNPDDFNSRPELADVVRRFHAHVTARQALNTVQAMEEARAAGCDWLLAIDADELVALDLDEAVPGSLPLMFEQVPGPIEAVRFRTLEVVQRRLAYGDVLVEETLFKRPDRRATRETYDPFARKTSRIPVLYGHSEGKMAVRLSVDAIPYTPHRFVRRTGGRLRASALGFLLHYYCHDFEAFVSKFQLMRDHPDRHLRGTRVALQKRLWRDVVNRSGMDEGELEEYYRRWVMFDEPTIDRLSRTSRILGRARPSPLVEVRSAQQAIESLGRADTR